MRQDCIKRDLEREGGEWRTTANDRSWRVLIENVVEEKMTVTIAKMTRDDGDNKRRTPRERAGVKTYSRDESF